VEGGYNNPFKMVPAPRQAAPPQGQRAGGGGGGAGRGPAPAPATKEEFERSEMDILYVADLVAKEYNTDPNRTYLMGNSAGGGAVWYLAQKYADRWTAISPSAGPLTPEEFPYVKMKNIPVLAVHGDQDTTMSYDASKQMIELAKKAGLDATFLGVPGGSHTEAWTKVLPETFDFFEKYKTKKK
jgi:pimeloyl-ACP methyl ester carboxylesterase